MPVALRRITPAVVQSIQVFFQVVLYAGLFIFAQYLVSWLHLPLPANLVGMILVVLLLALLLYSLTSSYVAAAAVAVVGIVALGVCYFIAPDLFASLLPNVLGAFSLNTVLTSFATDYVFDVGGLLLYLSLTFLMLFLTVQMIQRRRWN